MSEDLKEVIAREFALILGPGTVTVDLSGEMPVVQFMGVEFVGVREEHGWRFTSECSSLFFPHARPMPPVIEQHFGRLIQ